MKKLICLTIALLALCLPALAEERSAWDFDAGYCELNGYNGAGGDIVVPDEIDGSTVDVIQTNAFGSMDSITSLTLPDTLLQLKDSAICWCEGLTALVVDADEIETGAFTACKRLTSLHFTARVKTIGETFAMECPNLRQLCFDGELTNGLLLLTAAPQLTIHLPADASEDTAQSRAELHELERKPQRDHRNLRKMRARPSGNAGRGRIYRRVNRQLPLCLSVQRAAQLLMSSVS